MTHIFSYFRLFILAALIAAAPARAIAHTPSFLSCDQYRDAKESESEMASLCRHFPQLDWAQCANLALRELRELDPELKSGPREVLIVQSHEPNAFLLNQNAVAVTSALINQISAPGDLSFILAHELGHAAVNEIRRSAPLKISNFAPKTADALADELNADAYAYWISQLKTPSQSNILEKLDFYFDKKSGEFSALRADIQKRREYLAILRGSPAAK